MTVVTTAPLARTDAADQPVEASPSSFVSRAGLALAAGSLAWASALLTVGANPDTLAGSRFLDVSALGFQAAAFAVVTAMARTGATGSGRGARALLHVERVLLSLAALWTVLHTAAPAWADRTTWVLVLDAFWPLSMMGMLVIGIKVFRARRWRGPLRSAPLIAETWAPFTIGATVVGAVVGLEWLGSVVGGLHLVVGYARLGWLMHRHPELTTS